jgi:acetoacetate decarboxylase
MKQLEIRSRAYAMPLHRPSYPPGPYRFYDREYIIITYRTDMNRLRELVPEPLEVPEPLVKYEFIRMPASTGFGDYTESGQVIPVRFNGKPGSYVHAMYLDDDAPIAGGREIWGFPKKLANPKLIHEGDVIVGTLHYGSSLCATASMGYKHTILDAAPVTQSLLEPGFLLKIIPHVDGSVRICELVRYFMEDVHVKGAWSGPAALDLRAHVSCNVADLPVREIVSATHLIADLTLGLGEVVHDYLAQPWAVSRRQMPLERAQG